MEPLVSNPHIPYALMEEQGYQMHAKGCGYCQGVPMHGDAEQLLDIEDAVRGSTYSMEHRLITRCTQQ